VPFRVGIGAPAYARVGLAVEDPIAGDPKPGLLEPQYVSLLGSQKTRLGGKQNVRTARLCEVVEGGGDANAVVNHGGGVDDYNHAAGDTAYRQPEGLVVVDDADRKECRIHRWRARQQEQHSGLWAEIRPLQSTAQYREPAGMAVRFRFGPSTVAVSSCPALSWSLYQHTSLR
jgi:hypothetical protein